jgi:hypothetical protein
MLASDYAAAFVTECDKLFAGCVALMHGYT